MIYSSFRATLLRSFLAERRPAAAVCAVVFAALTLAGLWRGRHPARPGPRTRAAAPRRRAATPAGPPLFLPALPPALAHVRPDEVGVIPILMYHAVGAPATRGPRYDRHGLNISPATFRRQLDLMYGAGWYPVNMRDTLTARLDVPAGKTPVVLTFDDARGTQFRYRADGSLDPNCAVGILESFHARHPDWPLRATFYVLPHSRWNPVPFWQPGTEVQKLRFLVAQGFEVANHTTSHRLLCRMDRRTLEWEVAEADRWVRAQVPGATMDTLALPGGGAPRDHRLWRYLMAGRDGPTSYRNRCVLMAWGGPARAFTDRAFDPLRVRRIGVSPGYMERWLRRLRRGGAQGHGPAPYVSDGDPETVTVPRSEMARVAVGRLSGARLVVYGAARAPSVQASAK